MSDAGMTDDELLLSLASERLARAEEQGEDCAGRLRDTVTALRKRVDLRRRPVFGTSKDDEFPYVQRPMVCEEDA